jgi:hypothetical protein
MVLKKCNLPLLEDASFFGLFKISKTLFLTPPPLINANLES